MIKTRGDDVAALDDEPTRRDNDGNETDGEEEHQVEGLKQEVNKIDETRTRFYTRNKKGSDSERTLTRPPPNPHN